MDNVSIGAALALMEAMPDNAAHSAAEAAASAAEAKEAAESVTPATVAETKNYLSIT